MKLPPRKYIPLANRIDVVFRQLCLLSPHRVTIDQTKSERTILKRLLFEMFCDEKVHLDHDPPLGAREKIMRKGEIVGYIPDEIDPEYLTYRTETLHKLKTNVRGEHGQHPDRVLIKKQRRRERPEKKKRKTKWAKRKLQSASRWGKQSWPQNRSIRR